VEAEASMLEVNACSSSPQPPHFPTTFKISENVGGWGQFNVSEFPVRGPPYHSDVAPSRPARLSALVVDRHEQHTVNVVRRLPHRQVHLHLVPFFRANISGSTHPQTQRLLGKEGFKYVATKGKVVLGGSHRTTLASHTLPRPSYGS
jgi:hypothetical protein